MTYEKIKEFITKRVVLTTEENKVFRGVLTNTESEFDTESGKEEIELNLGTAYVGIPFDDIKRIIAIE